MLTEPLLERLKTKERGVNVIKATKLEQSEVRLASIQKVYQLTGRMAALRFLLGSGGGRVGVCLFPG